MKTNIAKSLTVLLSASVTALIASPALAIVVLASSILPTSRSVQVGQPATVFATIINAGDETATACSIAPTTTVTGAFSYQTTDSATNAPTGTANTAVDIAAGAAQSFVISLTPSAPIPASEIQFAFSCTNAASAADVLPGINTLSLVADVNPAPDVIAQAATVDNTGFVELPSATGSGAFSVASANIGAASAISVSADTGATTLPVNITICQTDADAVCINPTTPSTAPVTVTIAMGATPTFSLFATGTATIAENAAANRVFVRFRDTGGITRGSTSVAIKTTISTYFSVRPDFRRCIAPLCGGYFVKAVNHEATRCADGLRREECYVAEIRWDAIGSRGDPGAALVLGVQRGRGFPGFGRLGILVPKAAWRAAGSDRMLVGTDDQSSGSWFGLRHTDVVCVASPCYNIQERLLNLERRQLISRVDLSEVDADQEDLDAAMRLLRDDELIAVGKNVLMPDEGPSGDGVTIVASDFFLAVKGNRDDPLYCEVDADCTVSVYHSPVRSKDECYCPLCPQPVSTQATKENEASWLRFCRNFGFPIQGDNRATLICPQVLCIQPPPVGCVDNQCVNLDKE